MFLCGSVRAYASAHATPPPSLSLKKIGKAFVSSTAETMKQVVENTTHGEYLFQHGKRGTELTFGVPPEDPTGAGVIMAEVTGKSLDEVVCKSKTFSQYLQAAERVPGGVSSDTGYYQVRAASFAEAPVSLSLQQIQKAVRELSPARVSWTSWETWMDRMYGARPPVFEEGMSGGVDFSDAIRRTARLVVTFESGADLEKLEADVTRTIHEALSPQGFAKGLKATRSKTDANAHHAHDSLSYAKQCLGNECADCTVAVSRTLNVLIVSVTVQGSGPLPEALPGPTQDGKAGGGARAASGRRRKPHRN
jgi:hypothetical protein